MAAGPLGIAVDIAVGLASGALSLPVHIAVTPLAWSLLGEAVEVAMRRSTGTALSFGVKGAVRSVPTVIARTLGAEIFMGLLPASLAEAVEIAAGLLATRSAGIFPIEGAEIRAPLLLLALAIQ